MPSDMHHKHFQLGYLPTEFDGDPVPLPDDADFDAVWDDATTVEQYKADMEALKALPEGEVEVLRRAREGEG